jgi:general secretion pathway protein D
VEAAIRRLDVRPRQVLIEATIAEVTLTDNLSYGVRWFMEGKLGAYDDVNLAFGPVGTAPGPGGQVPQPSVSAFGLALLNGEGQLRLLFDLLQSESTVRFLSTPQVLVVDNQTANIRVGNQIPVQTATTVPTGGDNPVEQFQYRDTGTLLQVTPRINAGGLVTLEISQEVSAPAAGLAGAGGNPTINQRTVQSTVVVESGQTIVLGGLITETKDGARDGIPLLKDIPGVGLLFSNTRDNKDRTELIITVTPRVVRDQNEALAVTRELRQRLKGVRQVEADLGR